MLRSKLTAGASLTTIGEVVNNVVAFPSRRVAPSSGDLSSITLHDLMRALLRGDAIIIPKGSINA
jgi:hypothetical protein